MTRRQTIVVGSLGLVAVTGWVLLDRAEAGRRAELERWRRETAALGRLAEDNRRLARQQADADALRAASAAAEALRAEEAALNARTAAVRAVPPPAPRRAPERVALAGEVFDIARLDEKPKPVAQTRPVYPSELRQGGVTGSVVVDFVVMADGTVRNAFALRSTEPRLEAAAVDAVSQWKFEPGRKGGSAVQTHLQVPIVFSVAKNNEAAKAPVNSARSPQPAPWF
jgi:TonB family protein